MAKQRKHGSGTVRLRSDGRWEGRVVIGYNDSGLPKTKNVLVVSLFSGIGPKFGMMC